MNNKKRIFIILILIAFFMGIFILLSKSFNNTLHIVKDKSYFNDFVVSENNVFINCYIMIYNPYDYDKTIELYAWDYEDVRGGLLKNEFMYGIDKNTSNSKITVKSGLNDLKISFVGEFNNNNQKVDRNLPNKIEIKEVSK